MQVWRWVTVEELARKPVFDFDAVFDDDYLFFYETFLTPERTEQQVDAIWRILGLEPGMRVLDLACGTGRIARRLAARGCSVVGLDASPHFLQLAQEEATAAGVRVEYVQGDMRALPWSGEFDCIVNWFTSFGYFSDEDNRRVLRQACGALKPGGRLLIDHQNRDRLLREFQPVMLTERDGHYMIDRIAYKPLTGCIETERIVVRDGRLRRMYFTVRLFTFPELADWLRQAGFTSVAGFDPEGGPYSLASRRMIAVATR